MKLKKLSTNNVGLFQAVAVLIYCSKIAILFKLMEKFFPEPKSPEIYRITLMLFLLVFSAAISGLLIFGYPAYLMLHKDTKRALQILAYTFLYSLLILIIVMFFVVV